MRTRQLIDRDLAEKRLHNFIRQAWHVVEPATDYVDGWHIRAICEHLEAITLGHVKNLIINVPPGHMKSLTTVVMWPTWEWGPRNRPHYRYLTASYSSALSERDNNKSRMLIQSDWFQQFWGDRVQLTKAGEQRIENAGTGFRVASSVGGLGTGERVHRAIMDDLLRANDAHSEAMRNVAIEHVRAMSTRGVNPREFAQVLIMQRLHENDPTGFILSEQLANWDHLCLPAEFEPTRVYMIGGNRKVVDVRAAPTSRHLAKDGTVEPWVDPRANEGDLLWPQQYNSTELAKIKTALGSQGAAGQLQQRPSPAGGAIFKRGWFKFYKVAPAQFDEVSQSWDCTFKKLDTSDFVSGQVWGRVGANKYLLYRVNERMSFTETLNAIRATSYRWPEATAKLIEDTANGPAIIDTLTAEIPGIIAVSPEGGKVARAMAIQPEVEAGNVWLPDPSIAPWVLDFIEYCVVFPNGTHDDDVDAMTQQLVRWHKRGGFAFG